MVTIPRELRGFILHVYGPVKKKPLLGLMSRAPVWSVVEVAPD